MGLAARAGRVAIGTDQVRSLVSSGRVHLVLVASDLTANGRQRIVPLLEHNGLEYMERNTRAELGEAVGRGPTGAIGLTDRGLAHRIRQVEKSSGR